MSQKRLKKLNPNTNSYVARKRKAKLTRKSVLKMLAVMEASQSGGTAKKPEPAPPSTSASPPEQGNVSSPSDFLQSGRTGRRNALADILSEAATVTSSDLPSRLEGLTTKDTKEMNKKSENDTSKS